MKKTIAAILLVCVLLSLAAPAVLAAENGTRDASDLAEAAGDLFSDLGEKIRNGGKDLWSAFKEYLDEHKTSEVVEHLKSLFQETKDLTDEELREELKTLGEELSISLSDRQLKLLVKLIRKLEALDMEALRQQAEEWKNTVMSWDTVENALDKLEELGRNAKDAAGDVKDFFGRVRDFFSQAGDFIDGLF